MGLLKHGLRKSKEYNSWDHMKRRCNDPNHHRYSVYGGVGIKVCKEWADSFQAFFDYVGPSPSPAHTIDRYPNKNGNYEPGNVRWANHFQQSRNTNKNVMLTHNDETMCVAEWAEKLGILNHTIHARLRRGCSTESALNPNVRRQKNNHSCTPE